MKKICIAFIFLVAFLVASADADSAPPTVIYVESAKIVSEGAWFYMDITNIYRKTLNITMHTPFLFEEFNEYDTHGGFSSSSPPIYSIYVPFLLEPDETVRFHFHAPAQLHEENDTVGIYPITFDIAGWGDEVFKVQVVTLKGYVPQQNTDLYWTQRDRNFYKANYEEAKVTLETLDNEIANLKAHIEVLEWIITPLAAAVILASVIAIILTFLWKKP